MKGDDFRKDMPTQLLFLLSPWGTQLLKRYQRGLAMRDERVKFPIRKFPSSQQ